MSDEKATPAPVDNKVAQATTPDFNVDDLHKDIDALNKKLVSEDVAQLLSQERAKAKAEAEKEFLVNAKLKEKDQELENLKKAQLEKERSAAEQLDALRKKVDELASSKQPVNMHNPFNSLPSQKDDKPSVLKMKEDELEVVERASFDALMNRRDA